MERRKGTRLRLFLEIVGAVIAASAVFVAIAQYEYARHKDEQAAFASSTKMQHEAILKAVEAETEARKDGDQRLADSVGELVKSQAELTKASTTLITEMRFILKKLDLDGVTP